MALTRATDKIIANADGNLNLSGIVTASSFSGSGANLSGINTAFGNSSVNTSGIITASSFFGDGSNLTNLPAGLGTALSSTQTSPLNKIYFTDRVLSIGSTVTVDHPATATGAYTQYSEITIEDDADLIIADGDDLIPDILGLGDTTTTGTGGSGRLRIDTITNKTANGAPNFPNGLTGTAGTFTGNLNVGGVLTYEDVTNVDSIGVITARSDINLGDSIIHVGDTDTKIRFPGANEISFETAGSERVRINSTGNMGLGVASPNVLNEPAKFQELTLGGKTEGAAITLKDTDGNVQGGLFTSDVTGAMIVRTITNHYMQFRTNNTERLRIGESGQIGIGGANYGTSGQVLTSQGSGSAVQWANAGITMLDQWTLNNNYEVNGGETNLTADRWSRTSHALVGNIGGAMTVSSGVFTFPTTGIYLIIATFTGQPQSSASSYAGMKIQGTTDNFSSSDVLLANNYDSSSGNADYATVTVMTTFDCTNTSTHKIRFRSETQNNFRWGGGQGKGPVFIRIGDT